MLRKHDLFAKTGSDKHSNIGESSLKKEEFRLFMQGSLPTAACSLRATSGWKARFRRSLR